MENAASFFPRLETGYTYFGSRPVVKAEEDTFLIYLGGFRQGCEDRVLVRMKHLGLAGSSDADIIWCFGFSDFPRVHSFCHRVILLKM